MKEQIDKIKRSRDPNAAECDRIFTISVKGILYGLFTFAIVGVVIAIIISSGVAEYYDSHSHVDINAFGLQFSLDEENFFASPFMIFLYIALVFTVITSAVSGVLALLIIIAQTKLHILDNTHRTLALTELLIEQQAEMTANKNPDDALKTE